MVYPELINSWEKNTGQKWPSDNVFDPKKGEFVNKDHQLHHIIPQDVGGPHEWWNAHPLRAGSSHQGGVHGKDSPLRQIIKESQ